MRYALSALFFSSAALFLFAGNASPPAPPQLSAHFSPRGGCTDTVAAAIAAAEKTIHVQAYVLTSSPISDAIVAAKKRGVKIEVILDYKGSRINGSKYAWLQANHIDVAIDKSHAIAHNKIIIIDQSRVLTGSFNFTEAAESSNAENLITIEDTGIAAAFESNWILHRQHSIIEPKSATPIGGECKSGTCGLEPPPSRSKRR